MRRVVCSTGQVSVGKVSSPVERMRSVVVPDVGALAERGRAAWRALHSSELTREGLDKLEASLRTFGCACDAFYQKWKEKNPFPAEGSDRERFNWGVDLHNAVNEKLAREGQRGKRQWTHDEAWAEWRVGKECDRCGLCCRWMRIDGVTEADRIREPRLPLAFPSVGCPLIGDDNLCSCYETRPDVCRRFVAGSTGCAIVRTANGLPALQ